MLKDFGQIYGIKIQYESELGLTSTTLRNAIFYFDFTGFNLLLSRVSLEDSDYSVSIFANEIMIHKNGILVEQTSTQQEEIFRQIELIAKLEKNPSLLFEDRKHFFKSE